MWSLMINKPSLDPPPDDATPEQPMHSEDGVDLTLVRRMLSLTPAERLQVLQQSVESILSLRELRSPRDKPDG